MSRNGEHHADSNQPVRVMTALEVAKKLLLCKNDLTETSSGDAVKAVRRLVCHYGLRPIANCGASHRFIEEEVDRWARVQTEKFKPANNSETEEPAP